MDIPLYLGLALALLVAALLAAAIVGMLRRQWREESLFRLKRQKLEVDLAEQKKPVAGDNSWEGWRTFRVARLVRETADTMSVYFEPEDGRPLSRFLPGQYVTLSLRMPGEMKPVVRCYSLSHAAGENYYRCTVKEVSPPAGRPELPYGKASRHINRRLAAGELIDLKAPRGHFTLDLSCKTPVVLIGAGIGVTPLFSMLQAIAAENRGSQRQVIAFLQFRSGDQHPLKAELASLAKQHKHIQLVTIYSNPTQSELLGRDFDLRGRLTPQIVKKFLEGNGHEYYLCGPGPFMESMVAGLEESGVPTEKIHFEAFGPASVKKRGPLAPRAELSGTDAASEGSARGASGLREEVRFELSGITADWTPKAESLLELAEAHQIPIESGCRAGNCGTCAVAIKSGKVVYSTSPGSPPPAGTCLPCICVPSGPLVLQA